MITWQEYINGLDSNKKIILNKVFCVCEEFIKFSQDLYGDNSVIKLHIRIDDKVSNAKYADGNICIYSGLIVFLEEKIHSIFFAKNSSNEESYSFILWSVAHELSHHLQKHQKIKNNSNDQAIGFEFDADRIAITLLFNYLIKTSWAQQKTNIELKLGILKAFYIPFRLKSENSFSVNSSSTHPPWLLRLLYFVTFLAAEGNQSILCPESISSQEILFNNINNLDIFYKSKNPNHLVNVNSYKDSSAENEFTKVLDVFEEIRLKL